MPYYCTTLVSLGTERWCKTGKIKSFGNRSKLKSWDRWRPEVPSVCSRRTEAWERRTCTNRSPLRQILNKTTVINCLPASYLHQGSEGNKPECNQLATVFGEQISNIKHRLRKQHACLYIFVLWVRFQRLAKKVGKEVGTGLYPYFVVTAVH